MIDRYLSPLQSRILDAPARRIAARGIAADHVTLVGFGIGIVAVGLIAFGFYGAGLAAILLNRVADGLDGAVARLGQPTDRGAFADIAFDFAFYAAVPLGFALADPAANALAAAVLIVSFVGTGSSFLAFAVIAAGRGMRASDYPAKGIYYLGGLTEGAETILFFALACLWPAAFPWLACVFATLCFVTTILRWHHGWVSFDEPARKD